MKTTMTIYAHQHQSNTRTNVNANETRDTSEPQVCFSFSMVSCFYSFISILPSPLQQHNDKGFEMLMRLEALVWYVFSPFFFCSTNKYLWLDYETTTTGTMIGCHHHHNNYDDKGSRCLRISSAWYIFLLTLFFSTNKYLWLDYDTTSWRVDDKWPPPRRHHNKFNISGTMSCHHSTQPSHDDSDGNRNLRA